MSDQIGVAVIGSGYWGINYVRLLEQMPDAHMAIVCDPREERLQEVNRRFPEVAVTTELDDVLQSDEVDAVIVSTIASAHYDVTYRCLEAGKHALVEKPLTVVSNESVELIELAESKNLKLMVGHIFMYNSGVRKVKELIDAGDLGQMYYLDARRTNLGPIRSDVSAVWDLASHDVSIFNYLMEGAPVQVSAVGSRVLRGACCEDVAFLTLTYPNNVVGHIHVSWVNPNKEREIVIVGSDKRVVFNDTSPSEPVRIFEKGVASVQQSEPASFGEYKFFMRDGDIISPRIPVSEPLRNQVQHFIDSVVQDTRPLSDGPNGLAVVRVMEAAEQSISAHGAPVELSW